MPLAFPAQQLRLSFLGSLLVVAGCSTSRTQPAVVQCKLRLDEHCVGSIGTAGQQQLGLLQAGTAMSCCARCGRTDRRSPRALQPWATWAALREGLARPLQLDLVSEEPGGRASQAQLLGKRDSRPLLWLHRMVRRRRLLALQPTREICVAGIPAEVRLLVLGRLGPRDLAAVSACCRELRSNAEEDALWAGLFAQEFPGLVQGARAVAGMRGWRRVFLDQWRDRARRDAERRAVMVGQSSRPWTAAVGKGAEVSRPTPRPLRGSRGLRTACALSRGPTVGAGAMRGSGRVRILPISCRAGCANPCPSSTRSPSTFPPIGPRSLGSSEGIMTGSRAPDRGSGRQCGWAAPPLRRGLTAGVVWGDSV